MAPISRADLEAAHRDMVTALENVLFELGEVGRAKVKELTDTHLEIVTGLQDRLDDSQIVKQCGVCERFDHTSDEHPHWSAARGFSLDTRGGKP